MNKIVFEKKDGSQVLLDKSDIDPIAKTFMIPWRCVEMPPPTLQEGQTTYWENGAWVVIDPIPQWEEMENKE